MPWVKITDKAHENEKLQEASGDAVKLWLMGLSWANSELTDGHVPLTRAPRLTYMRKPEKVIAELLERRMWHRAAQVCKECIAERVENHVTDPVPSSGYYIHGYFGRGREKFQRPRWAIIADRLRLTEAGRRGGLAKPSAKQDASEEDAPGKLDAKHPAKPSAKQPAQALPPERASSMLSTELKPLAPTGKQPAQARTPVPPYPRLESDSSSVPTRAREDDEPEIPPAGTAAKAAEVRGTKAPHDVSAAAQRIVAQARART